MAFRAQQWPSGSVAGSRGSSGGPCRGVGAVWACFFVHWLFCETFELHPLKRLVLMFLDFCPEILISVQREGCLAAFHVFAVGF